MLKSSPATSDSQKAASSLDSCHCLLMVQWTLTEDELAVLSSKGPSDTQTFSQTQTHPLPSRDLIQCFPQDETKFIYQELIS